jgi:SAM-dependent methyltransferase
MTDTVSQPDLKTKHRRMWASGDYPAVAHEVIPHLGERVVAAAGIRAGDRVLDVGAGSGNAAIPAAALGADVIASDLTPELFEAGRRGAAERGVELRWEQGDAEALPYADDGFDAVISCVGVMFAPFHQAAADELVRVTRPGGTIANLSWTPAGFIGRMFRTMKPFAPPPPPGASPAPMWGDEAHVRELFGDRVTDLETAVEDVTIDRFASGAEFRDFFKATYGPTIAVYAYLGDDTDRVAELDAALATLGDDAMRPDGTMGWEYLLVTARKH